MKKYLLLPLLLPLITAATCTNANVPPPTRTPGPSPTPLPPTVTPVPTKQLLEIGGETAPCGWLNFRVIESVQSGSMIVELQYWPAGATPAVVAGSWYGEIVPQSGQDNNTLAFLIAFSGDKGRTPAICGVKRLTFVEYRVMDGTPALWQYDEVWYAE